ncbi:MAG: hypothetical protein H7838_04740 [Magnetococcus sp. DMHC-8]
MNTMPGQAVSHAEQMQPVRTVGTCTRSATRSLYQRFAQFHENARLIAWSTTLTGNIVLWAGVTALLYATRSLSLVPLLLLVPLMILSQWLPARRMAIIGIGAGSLFLANRLTQLAVTNPLWLLLDAGFVVGLLYLFFRIARSFARLPGPVRRHPQIALHGLLWCCIAAIALLPADFRRSSDWVIAANLTVCLVFFSFLIWRIGFMLYSGKRGTIKQTGFVDHLLYCLPYLGPTQVPYGKGLDYLLHKRVDERLSLARTQLAGLKLLLLAGLWYVVLIGLDVVFFSTSGRPAALAALPTIRLYHIDGLIGNSAQHLPALGIVWASLFVDMLYETMQLAITGHLIVGCLRLFGFNLFRNTYKPLLATSLVDFWNRYYYYFKELLVDFFFFPTYLSFFKHRPKLRIFAATMASACLGNVYYHLLQHMDTFIESGRSLSFAKFSSYIFYSVVLGVGIFVSILREQNQRGKPMVARSPLVSLLLTLQKMAGVWLFFTLLRIWDHPGSAFVQDTTFFFAILGIRL